MRRHVGGHTHCNTGRSIHQEVRDAGRQNGRLQQCIIEVGHEIHRFLIQVAQHFLTHAGQFDLCITHGGGGVAVNRSEVTLAEHQRITQRPFLRQTHHCKIYRGVAVRVILTHYFSYHTSRFLSIAGKSVVKLIHAEQHASMHRLEAVADIG